MAREDAGRDHGQIVMSTKRRARDAPRRLGQQALEPFDSIAARKVVSDGQIDRSGRRNGSLVRLHNYPRAASVPSLSVTPSAMHNGWRPAWGISAGQGSAAVRISIVIGNSAQNRRSADCIDRPVIGTNRGRAA